MRLFVFWLCICSGLLACESSKNVFYEAEREVGYDNGGKYVITRFKNPSLGDSAVIFGTHRWLETGDYLYGVKLKINQEEARISESYVHRHKLFKGKYRLKALYVSYRDIVIPEIKLNHGDSIRIDFYLTEADIKLRD